MGDVAAFAAASADNPAALNRRLVIGGPEGVSWRDVVAACEKVQGRDLPVRFVAPGEPMPGQREEVAGLMAFLEAHDSVIDMAETAHTFGVELTPLEVVVGRMFGGASS